MATLLTLANKMDRLNKNISIKVTEKIRKVAIEMAFHVIDRTPVDTSKAVSNWVATVGTQAISEIQAHLLGSHGSTAEASRAVAKALVLEALALYVAGRGQSIWISNLTSYIRLLDESHPTHAGFVAGAMLTGRTSAKAIKLGLK